MNASAATRAKWKERVSAWQSSGQSAATFAHGKDYQWSSLQRWAGQFRAEAARPAQFFKLVTKEPEAVAKAAPARLTLELGEVRIAVEEGFSPTLLAAVVRTLSTSKDGEK